MSNFKMKSRFEPEAETGSRGAAGRLIDPEAYDATEQEFAASLEGNAARPRFVVEGGDETQACDAPAEGPQVELASDCLRRADVTQPELLPVALFPVEHGPAGQRAVDLRLGNPGLGNLGEEPE